MPIPPFITALRSKIGHDFLWLSGVTAVVRREIDDIPHILLIRRADTGAWTPVTGVLDPCEEPAEAAEREVLEEAGIRARVVRLAAVKAGDPMVHANGDEAAYLDLCFECAWVSGDPVPDNEETTEAAWFPLDGLPGMTGEMMRRIEVATGDGPTRLYRRHGEQEQASSGTAGPTRLVTCPADAPHTLKGNPPATRVPNLSGRYN